MAETPNGFSYDRLGLLQSAGQPQDIFAEGPRLPSQKQWAELAANANQERLASEAQFIVNGFLNDPAWQQASLPAKRQLLDNWKSSIWPQYAQQAYGGDQLTELTFQSQVFGALDNAFKAAEAPILDSSGVGNVAASVGIGTAQVGSALARFGQWLSGAGNDRILARASALEEEYNDLIYDKAINKVERAEKLAKIIPELAELRTLIPDTTGVVDRFSATGDFFDALRDIGEEAAQERFPARADRALRNYELAQAGSDMPLIDQFLEGSWRDRGGIAAEIGGSQVPVLASTIIPGAAAARVGGAAAGLTAGAGSAFVTGAGQGAGEAYNDVMAIPDNELKEFPEYQILRDRGLSDSEARAEMAKIAINEAAPWSGLLEGGSVLLGPEGWIINRTMGPLASRIAGSGAGAVRRGAVGAGLGALEEGLVEGAQQAVVNRAVNVATGGERDIFEGVPDAAFTGALVGGPLGGLSGATSPAFNGPADTPAQTVPPTEPVPETSPRAAQQPRTEQLLLQRNLAELRNRRAEAFQAREALSRRDPGREAYTTQINDLTNLINEVQGRLNNTITAVEGAVEEATAVAQLPWEAPLQLPAPEGFYSLPDGTVADLSTAEGLQQWETAQRIGQFQDYYRQWAVTPEGQAFITARHNAATPAEAQQIAEVATDSFLAGAVAQAEENALVPSSPIVTGRNPNAGSVTPNVNPRNQRRIAEILNRLMEATPTNQEIAVNQAEVQDLLPAPPAVQDMFADTSQELTVPDVPTAPAAVRELFNPEVAAVPGTSPVIAEPPVEPTVVNPPVAPAEVAEAFPEPPLRTQLETSLREAGRSPEQAQADAAILNGLIDDLASGWGVTPEVMAETLEIVGRPMTDAAGLFTRRPGRTPLGSWASQIVFDPGANAATGIHEFEHLWVDSAIRLVNRVRRGDVAETPRFAQLRDDLMSLADWAGIPDPARNFRNMAAWNVKRSDSDVNYNANERVANAFVEYIATGEAPTPELQPVFARFRDWVRRLLRWLTADNPVLNPDINAVFARQLGAQNENVGTTVEEGAPGTPGLGIEADTELEATPAVPQQVTPAVSEVGLTQGSGAVEGGVISGAREPTAAAVSGNAVSDQQSQRTPRSRRANSRPDSGPSTSDIPQPNPVERSAPGEGLERAGDVAAEADTGGTAEVTSFPVSDEPPADPYVRYVMADDNTVPTRAQQDWLDRKQRQFEQWNQERTTPITEAEVIEEPTSWEDDTNSEFSDEELTTFMDDWYAQNADDDLAAVKDTVDIQGEQYTAGVIDSVRDDRDGSRYLGGMYEYVGDSSADFMEAQGLSGQASQLMRTNWNTYKAANATTDPVFQSYLNRDVYTVVADAVANPTDPWYASLPENSLERKALDLLGQRLRGAGFVVSENSMTPMDARGPQNIIIENGYAESIMKDLAPDVVSYNTQVLFIDKPNDQAYLASRSPQGAVTMEPVDYVPARMYDPRLALGGEGIQATTYLGSDGSVIDVRQGKVRPDAVTSREFEGFKGDVFVMDTESNIMGQAEYLLYMTKEPDAPMPESIMDGRSAAHPQATVNVAATGDLDAGGVLDAASDPLFSGQVYGQPGNPVIDSVISDLQRQQTVNMQNNVKRPTTAELHIDGAETSPFDQNTTTDIQQQSGDELFNRINAILGESRPISQLASADTRNVRQDFRPLSNALLARLQEQRRNAAAQYEGPENFAPTAYNPARPIAKWRSLATVMRRTFRDKAADFREWVMHAEPVANGEPDDHPVMKAFYLMAADTQASRTRMALGIEPFEKWVVGLAKRMGIQPSQVHADIGEYATARHAAGEGEAWFRQGLVRDVEEAADEAARLTAQARLDAYTEFQSLSAEEAQAVENRPDTAGGRNLAEWQNIIAELQTKYSQADLETGADMVVNGFELITQERLRAGTLTPEMIAEWAPFTQYVALTTNMESNRIDVDNAGGRIFNPGRDYHRQGSTTPAEPATDALYKYLSRASTEVGGIAFRREWKAMYDRLRKTGDTRGMVAVPWAEIEAGRRSENVFTADKYKHLADIPGFTYRDPETGAATKLTFGIGRDQDTAKYHDRLRKSMTGPAEIGKLIELATGSQALGTAARASANATKILGRMYTKFRLAFAPISGTRDFIERTSNIIGRDLRAADGSIISGAEVAKKMTSLIHHGDFITGFMGGFTGRDVDSYFARYWQEFANSGINFTVNRSLDLVTRDAGTRLDWQTGWRSKIAKPAKAVDAVFDKWNEAFNSVPAFLQYAAMRELNITPRDAAYRTLDLLNLYQQGTLTPFAQTLFPFFRPTVQGGVNMFRSLGLHPDALKTPAATRRGLLTLTGLTMGYSMIIPFLRGMAGDDDETGINRYDGLPFERLATAIPAFTDNGFVRIPMGFGIPQVSWVAANAFDRTNRGLMDPGEAVFQIGLATYKATGPDSFPGYSPSENLGAWMIQTFSPAALVPFADIAVNRNHFGQPITYGNRNLEKRSFESGRHTTPDVWHRIAKGMYDTVGVDFTPETLRHFSNHYLAGPLQGILTWMEEDSLYKSPMHKSTRDNLGPVLTFMGASSLYNPDMNLSQSQFYKWDKDLTQKLVDRGVPLTDPTNTGNAAKKEAFIAQGMTQAGFGAADVQRYLVILRSKREINKIDRDFRKNSEGLRVHENPGDLVKQMYLDWSTQRHNEQRQAVRQLELLR